MQRLFILLFPFFSYFYCLICNSVNYCISIFSVAPIAF